MTSVPVPELTMRGKSLAYDGGELKNKSSSGTPVGVVDCLISDVFKILHARKS